MKNENGITLMVLTITIIVLVILLSVSLNFGIDSIDEATDRRLIAELQMVQQATITEYTKAKQLGYTKSNSKPDNFVGTKINILNLNNITNVEWKLTSEPEEAYKAYYELTPSDLEQLQILNCKNTYILNYYTGEVYNKTKKSTSTGEALYIYATEQNHTLNEKDSFYD